MQRRAFITLLGVAAVAWPRAARAQQPAMRVIGFLNGQTAAGFTHLVAAFQHGLNENGFIEGQNVTIDYRWADGHVDRLPELSNDLVSRHVDVLVATGGANLAVKGATTTIPIIASIGGDPVKLGLVASLNRPGGNFTGVSVYSSDLEAKRLELLNEIVPREATVGFMFEPNSDAATQQRQAVETASRTIGREVRIVGASSDADLGKAFDELAEAQSLASW